MPTDASVPADPSVPGDAPDAPDSVGPAEAELRGRLAAAVGPLVQRLGGRIVTPDAAAESDVPVAWDGVPLVFVRLPAAAAGAVAAPGAAAAPRAAAPGAADLSDGLARLIGDVEAELGGPLSALSRPQKQRAVRLLEERGAFEMRRSAETVAAALGVTRFTVYNYLNRARDEDD